MRAGGKAASRLQRSREKKILFLGSERVLSSSVQANVMVSTAVKRGFRRSSSSSNKGARWGLTENRGGIEVITPGGFADSMEGLADYFINPREPCSGLGVRKEGQGLRSDPVGRAEI